MAHQDHHDPLDRPEVRWTVGCLIGAAALAGSVILAVVLAFIVTPPEWVQVTVGIALVVGVCLLTWIVVKALEHRRDTGRPTLRDASRGHPSEGAPADLEDRRRTP